MKIIKFLSLGISLILSASIFSGCSSDEETDISNNIDKDIYTPVGTYPIVKEGETDSFEVFAPLRPNVSTYDVTGTTKFMEELTGIELNFVEVTNADKKQKFNVRMTGGDYPEVILDMYLSHSELALYGQQGILLPLQDLIAEYAPNIQAALDKHPLIKNIWTLEDGNMYTVPRIGNSLHTRVSNRMWLNKEWLDNLDLKVPKTTEDFYNVLKAFKEQDANRNGDPNDEIPFSGAMTSGWNTNPIPYILGAFIPSGATSNYLNIDENGKVYYVKATDEWKECLKYLNRLYEEELLDPLIFSQTKDQLLKLGSNPTDVILGATTGGSVASITNTTNFERWSQYIALPPLEGPKGVKSATHSPDYGTSVLSISNACDNPEAVLRFFDYMYTEEGNLINVYGEKGIRYDDAPEGATNFLGEPAKYVRYEGDKFQDVSWNQLGPFYTPEGDELSFTGKENLAEDLEKILYESAVNDYLPVAQDPATMMPPTAFTTDESRIIVDVTTNMNVYIDQTIAEFITGAKDIDTEWDSYLQTLENYGLSEYVAMNQAAYDRYINK